MNMSLNRELYASELTVFSCTAVRVISKLHCTPATTGTQPDIVELPKPYANENKIDFILTTPSVDFGSSQSEFLFHTAEFCAAVFYLARKFLNR